MSSITPTSILNGYGENVCRLLNLLADRALVVSEHCWHALVYPSSTADEPAENIDDEEEIEDLSIAHGVIEEAETFDAQHDEVSMLHHSIIQPSVSKTQWIEETERVAAALKTKLTVSDGYNAHLMNISQSVQRIHRISCDDFSLSETLHATQVYVKEQIGQLQYGEKSINRSLAELSQKYAQEQSVSVS